MSDPALIFVTNCWLPLAFNGLRWAPWRYCFPLEAFVAYLDRATRAPLLPEWAAWLWEAGMAEGLIEPLLDAKGTYAWKVYPTDEDRLRIIANKVSER